MLTFLLLGLLPLLSGFAGDDGLNFYAMAQRASAATGVAWTSNIINVIRLALNAPGLWLYVLGSSISALAAVLVLAHARDNSAWLSFARRFHPLGNKQDNKTDVRGVYLGVMART